MRRSMAAGGLVRVQNPNEADFVEQDSHSPQSISTLTHEDALASSSPRYNGVSRLCQLLSDATGVDFGLYKGGTLRRRAERRMLLNGGGWDVYLERLGGRLRER